MHTLHYFKIYFWNWDCTMKRYCFKVYIF